MFKWFKAAGKKPDHPMHNAAEAAKLLTELPLHDPLQSLQEVAAWLESVKDAQGFRLDDRAGVIKLLDETGQSCQRKLCHEYLTAVRMQKNQENRLWLGVSGFWKQLAEAYLLCIEEYERGGQGTEAVGADLPVIIIRALRALSSQKKWLHMRYRPVESHIWTDIFKLYVFSETRLVSRNLVSPYPWSESQLNVLQELLRALMLEVSSLQSLMPAQIELTDRMAAHFASSFVFEENLIPETPFYIDMSLRHGPMRVTPGMQVNSMMRFFGDGTAVLKMESLAGQLERGAVPQELKQYEDFSPDEMLEVMRHLAMYWSRNPPQRKHARARSMARLSVVHEFGEIRRRVAKIDTGALVTAVENRDILHQERVDLKLYGFVTEKTKQMMADAARKQPGKSEQDDQLVESWVMEDISAGGMGAEIAQQAADWVNIGKLIGFRQEEGVWGVGIVRRLARDTQFKSHVGIQTIASEPLSVRLRPLKRADVSLWEKTSDLPSYEYVNAIILSDPAETDKPRALLLAANSFVPDQHYELLVRSKKLLIKLDALVERGDEFDWVSFVEVESDNPARQQ